MEKAERPKILKSITTRMPTGCGNLYISISEHDGLPFEVFSTLGKSGGCSSCYSEAVSRCISLGLRYGIPMSEYISQLEHLSCPNPALEEGIKVDSCPDAISKAMKGVEDAKIIQST